MRLKSEITSGDLESRASLFPGHGPDTESLRTKLGQARASRASISLRAACNIISNALSPLPSLLANGLATHFQSSSLQVSEIVLLVVIVHQKFGVEHKISLVEGLVPVALLVNMPFVQGLSDVDDFMLLSCGSRHGSRNFHTY